METIKNLPQCMAERALWARQEFIKNPSNSQIDDDCLVWAYNSEDKLWYSIAGNYSQFSPEEKRLKESNYLEKQEKRKTELSLQLETYLRETIYYSKIRLMVLKRDKYTCQRCGKKGETKFHAHHILKKVENGSDCLDNLITCCIKCHKTLDTKEYNPEWI